jgi:hypothetical protein
LTLVAGLQLAAAGDLAIARIVYEAAPAGSRIVEDVALARAGDNACEDLPRPPEGVPGLREYARIRIQEDGQLVVTAAQLPFTSNQGYVYRQTDTGWVPNEVDYLLLRTPVPVRGGFVYIITFGGGEDRCGRWSIDARHPR